MYNLSINPNGTPALSCSRKAIIHPSPIGILVCSQTAYAPLSAEICGENITVRYPCGDCVISVQKKNGYHKLTLLQVPEDTDGFTFGPYLTDGKEAGELLGAAWHEDGSAVCIQSLMPKVDGGCLTDTFEDRSGICRSKCDSLRVWHPDPA